MDEGMPKEEVKLTKFTNLSKKRLWSEEECRVFINAALSKLVEDAGGTIVISTADLFKLADGKTLAMSLSDDDKLLTLTRLKTSS